MMCSLKAVFWDLDGTIADTEMNGHRLAFNLAFEAKNLNWNWNKNEYADLLKVTGGINRISYYCKQRSFSIDDSVIAEIHKLKSKFYHKLLSQKTMSLRPGVRRLLEEFKENEIKQLLVTTSNRKSVNSFFSLENKLLKDYFDEFICYEDVKLTKPNPESYLQAIKKSKCKTQDCLAIEDSIQGLRAANAANIKTILTISPWKNINEYIIDDLNASIIANHLGEIDNPSKFLKNNNCQKNYINYDCIDSLFI